MRKWTNKKLETLCDKHNVLCNKYNAFVIEATNKHNNLANKYLKEYDKLSTAMLWIATLLWLDIAATTFLFIKLFA